MSGFHYLVVALASIGACLASIEQRQSSTNCSVLELVIARGTDEPGTYGIIVGSPLLNATQQLIPGVTGYAVPYPASFACDSESLGVNLTLSHLMTASQECPSQKYALVGYSQGADVMHTVALDLPSDLYSSVVALVFFGDPNNRGPGQLDPLGGKTGPALPPALANKLRENCIDGDPVCTNNGSDYIDHISYNNAGQTFINNSATYIQKQLYLNGTAGPDNSQDAAPGNQTSGNVQALLSLASFLNHTVGPSSCSSTASANATSSSTTFSSTSLVSGVVPIVTGRSSSGASGPTSTTKASGQTPTATSTAGTSTGAAGNVIDRTFTHRSIWFMLYTLLGAAIL